MAFAMSRVCVLLLVLVLTTHCGCLKRYVPNFANGVEVAKLSSNSVNEASGLCASRRHPGVLYTHKDSGGTHRIFAISATTATRLATIYIDGATAHDWEDIACGACPHDNTGHCIYVTDTGGNAGGQANIIYVIEEPADDLNNAQGEDIHVRLTSKLMFSWDQHDCENIMVSPQGSIYIVSKVHAGNHPKLVQLPSTAWGQNHQIQVNNGVYIPITSSSYDPVGGDISPNGREVLLKTYRHVYFWYVPDGNYYKHMQSTPLTVSYHHERQGEAVCFDVNGGNFYTLGEGHNAPLYMYRRTGVSLSIGEITG